MIGTTGWLRHGNGDGAACYRLAGLHLCASEALLALAGIQCPPTEAERPAPRPFETGAAKRAEGLIGGRIRSVRARYPGACCLLDLPGVGAFDLSARELRWARYAGSTEDAFVEALLGPALVLFLAARGRFAIHASAAQAPGGGAWLFLGDSGAGKSTLAAAAAHAGWQPVADDILPIDGDRQAWSAFPQLKLSPPTAFAGTAEPLAVTGIGIVERLGADRGPRVEPVPPREAALAMLRQSVAARLFPADLLSAQFAALTAIVRGVRTVRLGVPGRLDAVPSLYPLLAP